jgi:hypothetical protein
MSLKDTITSDLQTIESDLESPLVTWSGEDYICIPSSDSDSISLDIGGFSQSADIIFSIRKSLFANDVYPTSQQKVTYNSKVYRIETVREDVTQSFIRLICVDTNKKV